MAPVWRASRRDNRFEVLSFEYVDGLIVDDDVCVCLRPPRPACGF